MRNDPFTIFSDSCLIFLSFLGNLVIYLEIFFLFICRLLILLYLFSYFTCTICLEYTISFLDLFFSVFCIFSFISSLFFDSDEFSIIPFLSKFSEDFDWSQFFGDDCGLFSSGSSLECDHLKIGGKVILLGFRFGLLGELRPHWRCP